MSQSVTIREAEAGDAEGIAQVHVASWRATYAGIIPADYLAALSVEQRHTFWRNVLNNPNRRSVTLVAVAGGQVVGFAMAGPTRNPELPFTAWLYAIYLLAEWQGQGVGRRLVGAAVSLLLERGMRSMLVWVLAENPSRGFYEALGGQYVSEKEMEIGGAKLVEAGYGWKDVRPLAGPHS